MLETTKKERKEMVRTLNKITTNQFIDCVNEILINDSYYLNNACNIQTFKKIMIGIRTNKQCQKIFIKGGFISVFKLVNELGI